MPSFTDKLTVNGSEMDMYAAVPSGGEAPYPAVVIAFHVGGLDEFDKVMADRLAEAGYVAVVPDLFHRYTDEQLNGPRLERLNYLNDLDVIADMNAAVDFLVANSHVDSDRIGVTGFCMGGRVGVDDGCLQPHIQGHRSLLRRQHNEYLGQRNADSLRNDHQHQLPHAVPLRLH